MSLESSVYKGHRQGVRTQSLASIQSDPTDNFDIQERFRKFRFFDDPSGERMNFVSFRLILHIL